MSLMANDEVLEAKMVLAGATLSYPENSFFLRSRFSVTKTRLQQF